MKGMLGNKQSANIAVANNKAFKFVELRGSGEIINYGSFSTLRLRVCDRYLQVCMFHPLIESRGPVRKNKSSG